MADSDIDRLRADIRRLEARLQSLQSRIFNVGGRAPGVSIPPANAAYILAQGAAIPPELTGSFNLAVAAGTGLSATGNTISFDPGAVTVGGALRIGSGGTSAITATDAAMNLAVTQIVSTDNMVEATNRTVVINRSLTINSGKKVSIATGARLRIL